MGSLQEQFGTLPPAPDRRTEPRTTPASLTQVELGNGHSGVVLNISEAGMAVAVAHAFKVGEQLPRILFQLPGPSSSSVQGFEISAEIVWLSESKKGAGMQFVGLSGDARNRISSWIARERTAPEFSHLPKPVRRDRQPLQISSGRSRTTFSRDAIGDEEAGARYAKMFPSESANPRVTATLDEIKTEEEPRFSTAVLGHIENRIPGSPANSTPTLTTTSANEGNQRAASARIQTANRYRREPLTPHNPETQAADSKIEVSQSGADGFSSNVDLPEKSAEKGFKLQFAIFGFVLVAISFILGLTAGYAPIEKRLRSIGRPVRPPATTPSAPPAVLGEATSPAPAGETFASTEAPSPDEEGSHPENRPALSHSRSSNSAARVTPSPSLSPSSPSSTKKRLEDHSDSSLKTHKPDTANRLEANPKPNPNTVSKSKTTPAESSGVASSKNLPPSPVIESKESKPKAASKNPEERNDSTSPPAVSSAPTARRETEGAPPLPAAGSTPDVPEEPFPHSATPPVSPTPAPRPALHPAPAPANVVIPPAENGKLVRAILPRKSIADSPELGITSQLSVLISPAERSTVGSQETARLQAGEIITYVIPHPSRPRDRDNLTETVRVRATIGSDGRVTDVKPINGPIFLLSSVISAVHQWRFHPTFLNGSPVQAQDDLTIEFRQKR
jgi:hypothetical protein